MRGWLLLLLALPLIASAQLFERRFKDDSTWKEMEAQLPEFPKPENYLPVTVTATTPFDFYVDGNSISVGNDGVVRYSLIAKSSSGALNVTFEGLRCSEHEYRIYAFGRSDNTWSEARSSRWQPIPPDRRNAQREVLYSDYFCPAGITIMTPQEGRELLKSGGTARLPSKGF